MAEVQSHGIKREAQIKESGLLTSNPGKTEYTGAVDVPAGFSANPKNTNIPMQIKTVLGKSISEKAGDLEGQVMLADAMRNYDRNHIELVVEVMKQNGEMKDSLGIVRMVFNTNSYSSKIFGTLPKDELKKIDCKVKEIPLGLSKEEYKSRSKSIRDEITKLSTEHGCKAKIQPKISTSDSQRRTQCGCKLSVLKSLADHWDFISPDKLASLGLPNSLESSSRK